MKKAILLFLFVTTICFSQETIKKDLGSFDELKVFNGLRISLEKSTNPSITITGKKADEVVVKNINGRLKLSLRFPSTFKADEVDIILKYSDDLSVIDANEGSKVSADKKIKLNNLKLRSQEGSLIELEVKTKYLNVKTVSGGKIVLSGKTDNQEIKATSGGMYEAFKMESNFTSAVSSSGSIVEVNVSDVLEAKVRYGGKILYKGSPKEVNKKKIFGGRIKSVD